MRLEELTDADVVRILNASCFATLGPSRPMVGREPAMVISPSAFWAEISKIKEERRVEGIEL